MLRIIPLLTTHHTAANYKTHRNSRRTSSHLWAARSDTARGRRRGQAHVALPAGEHLNNIYPYIKARSSLIDATFNRW